MTTLIIHPNHKIQRKEAFKLITRLLQKDITNQTSHPDLKTLDGNNVKSIGIEEIRTFKRSMQFQPYSAPYQVGLILHAEALTTEAQNALLKILEEPGKATVFILTVANEKAVLPTILSRTKKIFVKEMFNSDDDCNRHETTAEDRIKNNDILSKIEITKFIDTAIEEKFIIIEEVVNTEKNISGIVDTLLRDILRFYRKRLLQKIESKANKDDIEHILQQVDLIEQTIKFVSYNVNKRLALENLILQLEESIM